MFNIYSSAAFPVLVLLQSAPPLTPLSLSLCPSRQNPFVSYAPYYYYISCDITTFFCLCFGFCFCFVSVLCPWFTFSFYNVIFSKTLTHSKREKRKHSHSHTYTHTHTYIYRVHIWPAFELIKQVFNIYKYSLSSPRVIPSKLPYLFFWSTTTKFAILWSTLWCHSCHNCHPATPPFPFLKHALTKVNFVQFYRLLINALTGHTRLSVMVRCICVKAH